MNNRITTRNLTEGALMAGLSAILVLAGSFIPVLGVVMLLVCGLPITIVTVRNGSYLGGLSAIVVVLLLAIVVGPISAISCGLQFILIAWIFGWMIWAWYRSLRIFSFQSSVFSFQLIMHERLHAKPDDFHN